MAPGRLRVGVGVGGEYRAELGDGWIGYLLAVDQGDGYLAQLEILAGLLLQLRQFADADA